MVRIRLCSLDPLSVLNISDVLYETLENESLLVIFFAVSCYFCDWKQWLIL